MAHKPEPLNINLPPGVYADADTIEEAGAHLMRAIGRCLEEHGYTYPISTAAITYAWLAMLHYIAFHPSARTSFTPFPLVREMLAMNTHVLPAETAAKTGTTDPATQLIIKPGDVGFTMNGS